MPVTIKKGEFKYKDPDSGEYKGVDAISERTTDEQVAAIVAKGQETLESIPEDYTELNDKVESLTDGFKGNTVDKISSRNLYNPAGFRLDGYAIYADGTRYENPTTSLIHISIPDISKTYGLFVKTGGEWIFTASRWAMYDAGGTYLGMASNNGNAVVSITDPKCSYIEMYIVTSSLSDPKNVLIIEATTTAAQKDYTDFGVSKLVYDYVKENVLVYPFRQENLFDKEDYYEGYYVNIGTGALTQNNDMSASGFMRVIPLATYSGIFTNHVCFYDKNKQFILGSGTNTVHTVTAPYNAAYARIDWANVTYTVNDVIFIQGEYSFAEMARFEFYDRNTFSRSYNLVDKERCTVGCYVQYDAGITKLDGMACSHFIPVEAGETYTGYFTNHLCWYESDGTYISGTNTVHTATAPSNAAFARIDTTLSTIGLDDLMFVKASTLPEYKPYLVYRYSMDERPESPWQGSIWSAYGDSITAISNGDGLALGWAKHVNGAIPFANFYGRGIGGQSFAWREHGGSVAFVSSDGNYVSRNDSYNKDNYSGEVPSGTTAIRGAFCSWDRITHMYPAAIKNSINLVYIMGGTNDANDDTALAWVANDTTDPEWAASSYYSTYGGDYNIETLAGGVASTIMKMQAWMPQAVIVIGTPLNGQTNHTGWVTPGSIPDEYQKSSVITGVSKMFGCPLVDVFGTCGINVLNSPTYITDGTHPYNDAGKMMLGRAVISGIKNVHPMIE